MSYTVVTSHLVITPQEEITMVMDDEKQAELFQNIMY